MALWDAMGIPAFCFLNLKTRFQGSLSVSFVPWAWVAVTGMIGRRTRPFDFLFFLDVTEKSAMHYGVGYRLGA